MIGGGWWKVGGRWRKWNIRDKNSGESVRGWEKMRRGVEEHKRLGRWG